MTPLIHWLIDPLYSDIMNNPSRSRLSLDLRPGVTNPVVLKITRRQVETHDLESVLNSLRILTAAREDVWRYRGQMILQVDGYNDDPRELVEIPEVRSLLTGLTEAWPVWAFFMNQVDESLKVLAGCVCRISCPGAGSVEVDIKRLQALVHDGFDGMNSLFAKHGFDEAELEIMSMGLMEYFGLATEN